MKRFIYILAAFALMGAVSCQPDEEVAVHASFTTDKESYDVGDPVVLTNTSTAENALIAICKWELGKGVVSYETTPENISYDQAGEYVIKLTVTSDRGAKKSSFEKTIRVVDNNIRPVADFTWSPWRLRTRASGFLPKNRKSYLSYTSGAAMPSMQKLQAVESD